MRRSAGNSEWLEKLGMCECAQRFADNKIDVSVLRHLADRVELRQRRSFGVKMHQLANLEFVFGHAWIEPSVANTPEVKLDDSSPGKIGRGAVMHQCSPSSLPGAVPPPGTSPRASNGSWMVARHIETKE